MDFRNTVVVMTSNIGARKIGQSTTLGFQRDSAEDQYRTMKERVLEECRKVFNPEFMNRVDEVLVFHRLTREELLRIVDIQMGEVRARIGEKALDLVLTDEAREFLVRVGSDEQYGARPLRRAVQQYIEDPLSELLLQGAFEPGTRIQARPSGETEKLVFEPEVPVAEGVTT